MGRPFLGEGRQVKRNITLSDELAGIAKTLGNGNISRGIRVALTRASGKPVE